MLIEAGTCTVFLDTVHGLLEAECVWRVITGASVAGREKSILKWCSSSIALPGIAGRE